MGFSNPYSMKRENKGELIYKIKKFYLFFRISGEISQFKQGMNEVGKTWDYIQDNANVFKPLFCYRKEEPSLDDVMGLFTVSYSVNGSNARTMEDATIYAWELFLQSIEDKEVPEVTFGELLAFVTGSDHIPPCGFPKKIEIDFFNDDIRMPHVSTCALQMWLPRAASPERLSTLLVRALKESRGFLKV
ncbi:G2/M phase-specific E3 ubiquitin-protein ligase-like [Ruditapes philippinarum]|uniref:G2/M phase-specific E3 ubiquitin-protein ligase-like n=1 Tax=Ruditapes philippinarum TaxID=129788 RepID=UPI00295B6CA8|nr:G2/M phase-specific E3 ubiquitin-protein ligase-like [Ruditapes philippinarum]